MERVDLSRNKVAEGSTSRLLHSSHSAFAHIQLVHVNIKLLHAKGLGLKTRRVMVVREDRRETQD